MIGTAMAMLALVMIPLGFALSFLVLRALDRRQSPRSASQVSHPSRSATVPLDDAPSEVIAEVARRARPGTV